MVTMVTVFFGPSSAPDYKARHQKVNAGCTFFIHKAHRIIRRIKWSKTQMIWEWV